ncbi:19253_t:CDS:2, partial [Cetraspora pellucida]
MNLGDVSEELQELTVIEKINFIPAPLPSSNKESVIADTLDQMQPSNIPIMWLNIDGNLINVFQTS